MRRCAFLSTDDLQGFVVYDELTYPAFAELGVEVEAVPWRAAVDWSRFELVVIRSPWDYQDDVDRFLDVLARIDEVPSTGRSSTPASIWCGVVVPLASPKMGSSASWSWS